MCAQFMIKADLKKLAARYGARVVRDFEWKNHVFPRYTTPVVVSEGGGRVIRPMQFALIPFWEKAEKPKSVFHNARSETLHEKPSFKVAFARSRCLVPLTEFFEYIWETDEHKWLARFFPKDQGILTAAGIWNTWKSPSGKVIDSFAMITKEPIPFIQETGHDRMPLLLPETSFDSWLEPVQKDYKDLYGILGRPEGVEFALERIEA